ncbi:MAG: glycosyltransferase [Actinomycetota bacterium]
MRIVFVVGREIDYTRNRVILKALRHAGCDVEVVASTGKDYIRRLPEVTLRLLRRAIGKKGEPDLYLVGFLGHTLLPVLRAMTKRPLVFDPFVSLHETLCEDRGRIKPDGRAGKLLGGLDAWCCGAADLVLTDTQAHAEYFAAISGQPKSKFVRLWVGADDEIYFPRERERDGGDDYMTVLYYATFQPLHGVEVVLDAVEMLGGDGRMRFRVVGSGPELPRLRARLEGMVKRGLLSWERWVPESELPDLIASSDICLGGHFSLQPKADRVIPGKIFQFMAVRKPVIAGDSRANRELLEPERHALLVPRGEPLALAEAVYALAGDEGKRKELAENAYRLFIQKCSSAALSVELMAALEGLRGRD